MKLNLGCGHNKLEGFVNVDAFAEGQPDVVFDLETFPWPWPDNSATHVHFTHSLEHMGGDPKVFLRLMQELYRVCAPGAEIRIRVPHPRHDAFINDPTHVRPVTRGTLELFDRQLNDDWKARGVPNTPFAHYLGVDFRIVSSQAILDEPFASQLNRGELSADEAASLVRHQANTVAELQFVVQARK